MFNKTLIIALTCLSLALGACGTTEKVKDYAFTKAANTGNQYCQLRDEQLVKSFGDGVNRELREKGAEFELKAEIICDTEATVPE